MNSATVAASRPGFCSIAWTMALPTTAPSANLPTAANCSGVEIPKPTATGSLVKRRMRFTRVRASPVICWRGPGTPVRGVGEIKTGGNLGNQLQPLVGRGWRSQKNGGEVVLASLAQILGGFFNRQIGDQRSVNPGQPRDLAELRDSHAQDGIEVGEDHQSDRLRMLANFRGESEYVLQRRAVFERPLTGALNHRAIGERIAEWDSEFDYTRTCVDGGEDDLASSREVGIAAGYIGDERWLVFEVKGHESIVDCGGRRRHRRGNQVRVQFQDFDSLLALRTLRLLCEQSS